VIVGVPKGGFDGVQEKILKLLNENNALQMHGKNG
jgi:hypothetical protein